MEDLLMNLTRYADVFLGNGAIELPEPRGVAGTWHMIKGKAGNTTPAAAIPFGKITACAYTGGYSSGYGHVGTNYGDQPRQIMEPGTIRGFSHIHHSGVGYIDSFYNYAVTAPSFEADPEAAFAPDMMEDEIAHPGYYAVTMRDRAVRNEMTVTRDAAHHRYTFPKEGGKLVIDFTNDGLLEEKTRRPARDLKLRVAAEDTVECEVILAGVQLYFVAHCPGAMASLWDKGCVFEALPGKEVRLSLGVSSRSIEIASKAIAEAGLDFDALVKEAEAKWEKAFSAIEVEAADERDLRIFYSNFYHTLVKPADWSGESFLYQDEDAFVIDLATLWDQYKTQTPLLFTLYPEISDKLVKTILAFCRAEGRMPHALLLDIREAGSEDRQAKMLAEHVLVDALYRGVPINLPEAMKQLRLDIMHEARFADYKAEGRCKDIAHTIDVADGMNAARALAEAAGDQELADFCKSYMNKWTAAFDRETGLLDPNSRYYEGSYWNYSFRLMHDMPTRVEIAGGKEAYAKLLDRFFGFTHAEDVSGRFEGFNNETDMETPYAYYYADRHDRVCQVVSDGLESVFSEGKGGMPGNNDSGGLSSLYMWNAMGIFPVSGQDMMMIGSPRLLKSVIHMGNGKDFVIRREGKGIYVQQAVLNGRKLDRMSFAVTEMMQGGELVLTMSEEVCVD